MQYERMRENRRSFEENREGKQTSEIPMNEAQTARKGEELLSRVRTIPGAAKMPREIDPGCAVTGATVRRAVASGAIHHVSSGNRTLVNFDDVIAYFNMAPAGGEADRHGRKQRHRLVQQLRRRTPRPHQVGACRRQDDPRDRPRMPSGGGDHQEGRQGGTDPLRHSGVQDSRENGERRSVLPPGGATMADPAEWTTLRKNIRYRDGQDGRSYKLRAYNAASGTSRYRIIHPPASMGKREVAKWLDEQLLRFTNEVIGGDTIPVTVTFERFFLDYYVPMYRTTSVRVRGPTTRRRSVCTSTPGWASTA